MSIFDANAGDGEEPREYNPIQGSNDITPPRQLLPDFEIVTAIHATADLSPKTTDVVCSLGGNRRTVSVLKRLQHSIIVRIQKDNISSHIKGLVQKKICKNQDERTKTLARMESMTDSEIVSEFVLEEKYYDHAERDVLLRTMASMTDAKIVAEFVFPKKNSNPSNNFADISNCKRCKKTHTNEKT
ncbi:Hypothetical predicted protein [Paramuricea clavata]|uniref:Uncharacterized protein n=1 Tax=Paramuricea clavata TaxID=317549 RepID=A0A6S7I1L1_PARCT|nr:Hypothetical predicted protein [Paramuricea clavata]